MRPERAQRVFSAADAAVDRARRSAESLRLVLNHTADTLDESARLAERHAYRREQAGRLDDAAFEHLAATRAREAAQRARSHAEELAGRAHTD
jgi:hypothetical protein